MRNNETTAHAVDWRPLNCPLASILSHKFIIIPSDGAQIPPEYGALPENVKTIYLCKSHFIVLYSVFQYLSLPVGYTFFEEFRNHILLNIYNIDL